MATGEGEWRCGVADGAGRAGQGRAGEARADRVETADSSADRKDG